MNIYSIYTCNQMISHYEKQAQNQEKPQRWRDLAALSVATWKWELERAQALDD